MAALQFARTASNRTQSWTIAAWAVLAPLFFTGHTEPSGWAPSSDYGRLYDVRTVETVSGRIVEAREATFGEGMSPGVVAELALESGRIQVHLGPSCFLEGAGLALTKNDSVTIRGSRAQFKGRSVLLAAEVSIGQRRFILRDPDGFPAWAGFKEGVVDAPGQFALQFGERARGEKAFVSYRCFTCHVVARIALPKPGISGEGVIALGGPVRQWPTRLDLANSIVNPSHALAPGYAEELVKSGRLSRMGDYTDVLTVRDLADLIAFLQSAYEIKT